MKIALDTNRLTDLAEMTAGFLGGTRQAQNSALMSNLLDLETVAILYPGVGNGGAIRPSVR